MQTVKRCITGAILVALLAIGGVGFTVQSGSAPLGAVGQSNDLTLQKEARANEQEECVRAENRNCGWFSCYCEGPTTRECAGCGPS